MSETAKAVDWAAYLDQASAVQALSIDPAWRAGVTGNLERLAQVAAAVNSIPLTEADEAAGVFTP